MKNKPLYIVTVFILLSFQGNLFAQEILGRVEDEKYINTIFGFELEVVEGWEIQDEQTRQQLMNVGVDIVAGNKEELKDLMEESVAQNFTLFLQTEKPLGVPGASMIILVENLAAAPHITSGESYLENAKLLMLSAGLDYEFPKDIYSEEINGTTLYIMEGILNYSGKIVSQKYYCYVRDGFSHNFILSYPNTESLPALEKSIRTLKTY